MKVKINVSDRQQICRFRQVPSRPRPWCHKLGMSFWSYKSNVDKTETQTLRLAVAGWPWALGDTRSGESVEETVDLPRTLSDSVSCWYRKDFHSQLQNHEDKKIIIVCTHRMYIEHKPHSTAGPPFKIETTSFSELSSNAVSVCHSTGNAKFETLQTRKHKET